MLAVHQVQRRASIQSLQTEGERDRITSSNTAYDGYIHSDAVFDIIQTAHDELVDCMHNNCNDLPIWLIHCLRLAGAVGVRNKMVTKSISQPLNLFAQLS